MIGPGRKRQESQKCRQKERGSNHTPSLSLKTGRMKTSPPIWSSGRAGCASVNRAWHRDLDPGLLTGEVGGPNLGQVLPLEKAHIGGKKGVKGMVAFHHQPEVLLIEKNARPFGEGLKNRQTSVLAAHRAPEGAQMGSIDLESGAQAPNRQTNVHFQARKFESSRDKPRSRGERSQIGSQRVMNLKVFVLQFLEMEIHASLGVGSEHFFWLLFFQFLIFGAHPLDFGFAADFITRTRKITAETFWKSQRNVKRYRLTALRELADQFMNLEVRGSGFFSSDPIKNSCEENSSRMNEGVQNSDTASIGFSARQGNTDESMKFPGARRVTNLSGLEPLQPSGPTGFALRTWKPSF